MEEPFQPYKDLWQINVINVTKNFDYTTFQTDLQRSVAITEVYVPVILCTCAQTWCVSQLAR